MDCNKVICLYLNNYLTDEQFEQYFYNNINCFENDTDEGIYLEIISTDFNSKKQRMNLIVILREYIFSKFPELYNQINDGYIEQLLESHVQEEILQMLKDKYKKEDIITIDCNKINTKIELISLIKDCLKFPRFCGDNWDAISDLIYDIILPQKLIFLNYNTLEKRLPEDTKILKDIFNKVDINRCLVRYESDCVGLIRHY